MNNPTKALRKLIYQRDNYACALCDSNNTLQIHHVVRRSQGGSNHPCNLITLCAQCHALAHGVGYIELQKDHSEEDMELDCIIYLSELYAQDGIIISDYNRT